MRYPLVLVDVGGTLVGPRESFGSIYARVLGELGFERPVPVLERSLRDAMEEMERRVPPGKDRYRQFADGEAGYWREFARLAIDRAVDGDGDPGLADRALGRLRDTFRSRESWEIYQDVPPALDALRGAGVRLGVVSNWDSRLPDLLKMLGLADYFETIVVSHLEGLEKPDPAIFERALQRMGGHARQALYVGDRPEIDLEGARAAGMDAVIVNRTGRLAAGPTVISDFGRLPAIALDGI